MELVLSDRDSSPKEGRTRVTTPVIQRCGESCRFNIEAKEPT